MHIEHPHRDIVTVKGINDTAQKHVLGKNTVVLPTSSSATKLLEDIALKADAEAKTTPKSIMASASIDDETSDYHKCRPKAPRKHNLPKPLPTPSPPSQETEPPRKSPKSEFVTVTHSLIKVKKIRRFRCKICSVITESQAMANSHYRSIHPPIKCPDCDLMFNNPNSLRRHKYTHIMMKFPCRSCGKTFEFDRDLTNHRLNHHHHPGHQCNHEINGGICGKWFFAKSDLMKHAKTHSGKIYSCFECNYMTLDIHYLRAHRYTHSNKQQYRYQRCDEPLKHHMQLLQQKQCCMQ